MASSNAFPKIFLTEDDVPGAKLVYPEVENHSQCPASEMACL